MDLREQLARDEGLRLIAYQDTTGHLTIGFGRNLSAKGISFAEAEMLLNNDIAEASREVAANLPWSTTLDEARLGVLRNMAFNMGIHGLLGFRKMLAAVEVFDYERAAAEMEGSRWYEQVGPRAHRLVQQMRSGRWV